MRRMLVVAWLASACGLPGQVTFEVASIKSSGVRAGKAKDGPRPAPLVVKGSRVEIGPIGLGELIRTAYELQRHQLTGPLWMSGQRFNVQAKLPEGASAEQIPGMLQALLAERFGLVFHRERKELPVYFLVAGKGGPRLTEADPGADSAPRVRKAKGVSGGMKHLAIEAVTMPGLAKRLSGLVDRPVLDRTGLAGRYQVALDLARADIRKPAKLVGKKGGREVSNAEPDGFSVFRSVQELGLKLEPQRAAVEILVVDHLDKMPTEN